MEKMSFFSFDKQYKGLSVERILRHLLYWSFWLAFYTLVNGSYDEVYYTWFVLELFMLTVKIPFTYIIVYYLLPKLIPKKKYIILIIIIILLAFFGVSIIIEINKFLGHTHKGQPLTLFSGTAIYRTFDLVYVASLVVIIKMIQQNSWQQKVNAELKEEKIGAELQILKNQLQPHFLFNTLNNIYSMALSKDDEAPESILRLSNIISYMLYDCSVERVDLEKELELIKNYIELEKLRYGNRLDLSFDIQGNVKGKMIAPLLLLPFVENAFKHGASMDENKSWIRINLSSTNNNLEFFIENSIPNSGVNNEITKSGIGLSNIKKRLKLQYTGKYNLNITQSESYLVKLKLEL